MGKGDDCSSFFLKLHTAAPRRGACDVVVTARPPGINPHSRIAAETSRVDAHSTAGVSTDGHGRLEIAVLGVALELLGTELLDLGIDCRDPGCGRGLGWGCVADDQQHLAVISLLCSEDPQDTLEGGFVALLLEEREEAACRLGVEVELDPSGARSPNGDAGIPYIELAVK